MSEPLGVKVLCVDDEARVLEGLALHLRRKYELEFATSGAEGLQLVEQKGPFAVVLSDMQMPGLSGAEFLARVRRVSPDTVRMLLTGHADVDAAVAAVNEGQIFRFLTKPCPPAQLRLAFGAAVKQYNLVTAERELLEKTLQGTVKVLADILSMTNPVAFGRTLRIKQHASKLVRTLGLEQGWQVEMAAMLSQLGAVSLPQDLVEKLYHGGELSEQERELVDTVPGVTEELLSNIPRLEPVRDLLAEYGDARRAVSPAAAVLRIVVDFDALESKMGSAQLAFDTMYGRGDAYDSEILRAFIELNHAVVAQQRIAEIPLMALRVGMVFADDVRTKNGVLVVTRGYEVTPGFMRRARNFKKDHLEEPLRIVVDR